MGSVIWTMMAACLTFFNFILMISGYINGNTNSIIINGIMVIFWYINYRDSDDKL